MPSPSRARWSAVALAAALTGCVTVGPSFTRPQAPAESRWNMAGDATTRLAEPGAAPGGKWWLALGSTGLDALVDQALAGNQTLAQADADLAAARDAEAAVAGDLRPRADLAASAQRERINTAAFGFAGFPSPTISLYTVGPSVSYDLDVFGGGRRHLEQAHAQSEAAQARAAAARLTLTGQVTLAAVRIAAIENRLAALDAIIADDEANLALVRRAQAAGAEAPSATHLGLGQLAADEALRPPLAQALAQQRHMLALLVGRPPGRWTAPTFVLADFAKSPPVPMGVPGALVRRRPDLLAAEDDLHAATAAIGVAQAARYPDLRLTASLTQEALSPDKLFSFASTAYAFGGGLTAPLFHGGALKANQRQAEARARAALFAWRQAVLTAYSQVADVLSALGQDEAHLDALGHSAAAAQAALNDARTAYRLGGGTLLAVTTEQRQLDEARLELADAQGQRLADLVQLFAATAGDWR